MRTIGLIGGMSWESSAVYYRMINEMVRQRAGGLHSAEIVLRSLDFERIVALQRAERWDEAGRVLGAAGAGLAACGADCVLICTNTMHLVAGPVAAAAGVPLIDIITETGRTLTAAGCRRPLLLATRYTMEQGFYARQMQAEAGIEVMIPSAPDRLAVHSIIFDELCRGEVLAASRRRLLDIIHRGLAAGADGVILGCTEICLILDPDRLPCAGFDSTAIHARAAVDFALREAAPGLLAAA